MKIVMTFGTFDKLHPGHLSYLRQAKKYGDYLIVVVARDKNVLKIKGRSPAENEKKRWQRVKESKIANRVVLGRLQDRLAIVKKYKPDVICLGYDQVVDMNELKKIFKGKIARMKAYKEGVYKSSKLVN